MISAPFLIIVHHILKDTIHLFNDVHLDHLHQLNFTRLDDSSDDLNCESIEFRMINLKVLEKDLNEL